MIKNDRENFSQSRKYYTTETLSQTMRQSKKELIVEFKGRVIAINNENAEITIYEDGRNTTYTGLDPSYLREAGLDVGDPFIFKIVNDAGLDIPIFLLDKALIDKRLQEIGPKTEESREKALESQRKMNEIYNALRNNESEQ